MRLTALEGFSSDHLVFLAKFGQKEHLEELQSGTIYMNNLKRFIDKELREGKKGIGDRLEATNVIFNPILEIGVGKDEITTSEGEVLKAEIRLDRHVKKPVFCVTCIDYKDFTIKEQNNDFLEAQLDFREETRRKIEKDFGEHVLLINNNKFLAKLKSAFGNNFIFKRVIYADRYRSNADFSNDYRSDNPNLFYWKDKSFEYQNEKRLVLLNDHIESAEKYDIGDLSSITHLTETTTLLNGGLTLNFLAKGNC